MTVKLIYPEFSKVKKMQGLVRVLSPLFNKDLGRFLVDDGMGNWNPIEGTPAIYLGNPNIPSPDYPRFVLSFLGVNDLDGAKIDSGWTSVENPDYNPDDPSSQPTIDVPYESKYVRYNVQVQAESGNLDEVYRGDRKSSDELLTKMLTSFLSDEVRKSMNDEMVSTIAQTNRVIPQTDLGATTYHDSSFTILTFHTITTYLNYSAGVFNSIEYEYDIYRTPEDTSPIKGENTIPPINS
ncbi:hypothetical protein NVP1101O_146 [Vibrio phage 1.101.O._10N.261.45.C6]|nr:hypothetical protein NVP1101O_146 [Vibrio phage 1.101.O._10N.261.45.C6]